ncbi:MAG TPA: PadR family transcriptional regulator [Ktedonobacteraceae bacterium]|jgi:DNA-binding PadR family transcriptional regulator|nr:PadR family transcriptional regulator [Ktedonobacteraceae bacterium]
MAKENKSKYALLGALSFCPGSGYDIKKFMEQSTGNFWNESYGQIYPMLKQLVDEGLATSHSEKQEGKPERYVYTLTEKGREELQRWLTEPIEYSVERNELLLKLFYGQQTSIETNIQHVQSYRALQEQLLDKYQGIEKFLRQGKDLFFPLLTVRYGIHRCRALLEWCDETLAALQSEM